MEQRTIRKVAWRIMPIIFVCYGVAIVDRVNVGFAALTMNKALGFSAEVFGFGAGVFFLGYFLFEVPSNLLLRRYGARRWIARIMVTWGVLSALNGFVWDARSFYAVRFLLGLAEAGFFPGIILYMTYWFPSAYRARIIGLFMAAQPLGNALAAPLSGYLLGHDGLFGLQGWQLMFVIEAIPAVLLGLVVLRMLRDRPADAEWLAPDERAWLARRIDDEEQARAQAHRISLRAAFTDWRVLLLCALYFLGNASQFGFSFFLPQIVKQFGAGMGSTGLIVAVPYLVGVAFMLLVSYSSDRTGERRWHLSATRWLAGGGLVASTLLSDPVWRMVALTVAACGIYSGSAPFWALPTGFLSGAAAAAALALINAVGNLAGFFAPWLIGIAVDQTGSTDAGYRVLALIGMLSPALIFLVPAGPRTAPGRLSHPSPAR